MPDENVPKSFGRAYRGPIQAFIMLIRLRGDLYGRWRDTGVWPVDAGADAALAAHSAYWQEQLEAGRAILAGGMEGDYWDNVALIVFEAESEEAAHAIVENDPAVKAYVFQAQIRPFQVHFVADKWMHQS